MLDGMRIIQQKVLKQSTPSEIIWKLSPSCRKILINCTPKRQKGATSRGTARAHRRKSSGAPTATAHFGSGVALGQGGIPSSFLLVMPRYAYWQVNDSDEKEWKRMEIDENREYAACVLFSYTLIRLILSSIGLDFGNRNFLWHLRGWTWPPAPRGGTGPGRSSAPDCKGKKNILLWNCAERNIRYSHILAM